MLLKLYVAIVTAAACALGVAAAVTTHPEHSASVELVVVMGLLLWLTEILQVRKYNYRGHGLSLNLIEGVMAPLVLVASGRDAVLTCLVAVGAAEMLRRVPALKVTFNTAMWTLAAGVGSLPSFQHEVGAGIGLFALHLDVNTAVAGRDSACSHCTETKFKYS